MRLDEAEILGRQGPQQSVMKSGLADVDHGFVAIGREHTDLSGACARENLASDGSNIRESCADYILDA